MIIQKNLRMYAVRVQVERQRQLESILEKPSLVDEEMSEKRGEGLKMSDLSYTINHDEVPSLRRNQINTKMISELIYPIPDSKETSSRRQEDLLKKDSHSESQNVLDFENTERPGIFLDERELSKNQAGIGFQVSPLKKVLPEDDISIISSRIDINRKGLNNSTFEKFGSNQKSNLEGSRLLESIGKKKPIYKHKKQRQSSKKIIEGSELDITRKTTVIGGFKRKQIKKASFQDRNSSLILLKKSLTERHFKELGKHKDSSDALFKTHNSNIKKNSLFSRVKSSIKRPGSAGVNPSNPLDIGKMKSSLVLLKKSIQKSQRSSSNKESSQECDRKPRKEEPVQENSSLNVILGSDQNFNTQFPIEKFKRPGKSMKYNPKSEDKLSNDRSLNTVTH